MAKLAELQGRLEKEAGDTGGEGGTDEEGDEEDEEEDDDDDRGSRASGKSVAPCRISCEWPTVEDAVYPCTRKGSANGSGGKRYEYTVKQNVITQSLLVPRPHSCTQQEPRASFALRSLRQTDATYQNTYCGCCKSLPPSGGSYCRIFQASMLT